MRSVHEITRVRVGRWVKVKRQTGEEIVGEVVGHHDLKPTLHDIKLEDGSIVTVDLLKDVLTKMTSSPIVKKPAPAPVIEKIEEPVIPVAEPRREWFSVVSTLIGFVLGATFGGGLSYLWLVGALK